ncbi:hypothetical protein MTO96_013904 [Rhipicephalus appendiculatus]
MAVAQRRSHVPDVVVASAEPSPLPGAFRASDAGQLRDRADATGGEALAGTAVDGPGTRPAASQEQPNRNAPERKTGNHGGHEESSVTRDAVRPWTAANQGSRAVGRRPILRGPAATTTGVGHQHSASMANRQLLRRHTSAACLPIFAATIRRSRSPQCEQRVRNRGTNSLLRASGAYSLLRPPRSAERGAPVFRDRREMLSRKTRELAASAHQRDRDKSLASSPSTSEPPDERTLWRFHLRYPARGCRCRL